MTWREAITHTMDCVGDTWADVESCTLSEAELDVEFDDSYGATEGAPFTLWTKHWVYFPVCYDGSEWAGAAARNPNGKATGHQGGG